MSRRTAAFDYEDVMDLVDAAQDCTPTGRAETVLRRFMNAGRAGAVSDYGETCAAVDAVMMTGDLILSQPSGSGTTAFDRLANRGDPEEATARAALAALRAARFRLLRLDAQRDTGHASVRDVLSGEALDLLPAELPSLPAGTMLFARVAMLDARAGCLAGYVTPLDEAACDAARQHPLAGRPGAQAGARWAEAVYSHVVRHGTLDVPGLNRPRLGIGDDDDPGEDSEYRKLLLSWLALGGDEPGAELLEKTRLLTCVDSVLIGLAGLAAAEGEDDPRNGAKLRTALRRMLLVQVETVLRRERTGSTALTHEAVRRAMEVRIAEQLLPPGARVQLEELRQVALAGAAAPGVDDAELARLMGRIRGLRAKTVEQGCTEQEALAAAEKVAELLDRYGLSLGQAEFDAQPCEGAAVQTARRRVGPLDECVPRVADFFDCRMWVEQAEGEPMRYVFFGLRADVEAARALYDMVDRAFATETDAFRAGPIYADMAGERRSATNSFQLGLAVGICRKLRELQEARHRHLRSASGRDLVAVKAVMVDGELAKLGLHLRARGASAGKRVLSDAYDAGQAAGARFEVAPALSQAA